MEPYFLSQFSGNFFAYHNVLISMKEKVILIFSAKGQLS